MKAISLLQPWASLLAFGAKQIETRSWPAPAHLAGQPVAIHASMTFEGGLRAYALGQDDVRTALSAGSLQHYGYDFWDQNHPALRAALERDADFPPLEAFRVPTGAILAVGSVVECRSTETWLARGISPREQEFGDFSAGRFGWRFITVNVLREPVPCKGALGIWAVRPDVARLVEDELQRSIGTGARA